MPSSTDQTNEESTQASDAAEKATKQKPKRSARKPSRVKPSKNAINELKHIAPFAEIMGKIDDSGQYDEVQQIELRRVDTKKRLNVSERNFLKNQAIALMMHAGFSPNEVSQMLSLSLSTVCTWKAKATPEMIKRIEASELASVERRIANAVNTCLSASERIALFVSERDYIQKQPPEQVEKLFNMCTGFSVRLVEAKQRIDSARKHIERDRQFGDLDAKPQETASIS